MFVPNPVLFSRIISSPWWPEAVVSFSCLKKPPSSLFSKRILTESTGVEPPLEPMPSSGNESKTSNEGRMISSIDVASYVYALSPTTIEPALSPSALKASKRTLSPALEELPSVPFKTILSFVYSRTSSKL